MKPTYGHTIIAIIVFTLSACCQDDKHCVAGDPASYPASPYQPGQHITYRDIQGRSLVVQLNTGFNNSEASTQTGPCAGSMKQMHDCYSSIQLSQATLIDSAKLLPSYGNSFSITQQRSEENMGQLVTYTLQAFSSVYITISNYGPDNNIGSSIAVPQYTTPYKTYNNIYLNQTLPNGSRNLYKHYFTKEGKLISFSINNDTTNLFYLVE